MNELRNCINELLNERDAKGQRVYGQSLAECPDNAYSWDTMLQEELLDGIQYAVKQNMILRKQLAEEKAERERYEQAYKIAEAKVSKVLKQKYTVDTLLKGRVE